MTAEIIAIGTELLLGDITDTNSQQLAKLLAKHGVDHFRRGVVGDNLDRAAEAIKESLSRADVVFTIGGLGPTPDDLTREAICQAIGDQLLVDERYLEYLKKRTRLANREWIPSVGRMAERPSCATLLRNDIGAAPGLLCEKNGKFVIALPGPRSEFWFVAEDSVEPWLAKMSGAAMFMKTIRIVGIPESAVCEKISDLLELSHPTVAPYAKMWEVHLRVAAKERTAEDAAKTAEPIVQEIVRRFGDSVFGFDEQDLSEVVVQMLLEANKTVSTAESCTGGMLGQRITSVPGSSGTFIGGLITYTNEMKAKSLNVSRSDLERFGAVSETVACQMAEGVRRLTGSDFGIGITGIAGPGGGSELKPVGLTYIALASETGTTATENRFPGDRELIRYRATQTALDMLRRRLLGS